jgi:hypothetical protein
MGLKRLIVFAFMLLLTTPAFSMKCDVFSSRVEEFFENFRLKGDRKAFQAAQTELLSPHALTSIEDARGTHVFLGGSQGYFEGLKYWRNEFQTGPDFYFEVVLNTSRQTVARLHGKIKLKHPIQGVTEVADSEHTWTVIFKFNDDNRIAIIDVRMNLFKPEDDE